MNAEEIRALHRSRTVVLMPGGVLEQHGPHLPSFTDGYMNEWWTRRIAEAIAARPGWQVVVFPMLPLGDGGANEIGGHYVWPGSYGLRLETLRAVYMDFASELGHQGFKWIFVVQNHGSPMHNKMLDEAAEYFGETFGGVMVNLTGLAPEDAGPTPAHPYGQENGAFDIHAGLSETSRLLFLRPDLVSGSLEDVPSIPIAKPQDLGATAARADWKGYFGAPRHASAAYGAAVMEWRLGVYVRSALQILDGRDPKTIPRYADTAMLREADVAAGSRKRDAEVRRQQEEWLRRKGYE
jgi:creatinine amidohydrolase/Fe(II)-dependent formamide hydrolase-like protein